MVAVTDSAQQGALLHADFIIWSMRCRSSDYLHPTRTLRFQLDYEHMASWEAMTLNDGVSTPHPPVHGGSSILVLRCAAYVHDPINQTGPLLTCRT